MEINIRDTAIKVFGNWSRPDVEKTAGISAITCTTAATVGYFLTGQLAGTFAGAALGAAAPTTAIALNHAKRRYGARATALAGATLGLLVDGSLTSIAVGAFAGGLIPTLEQTGRRIGSWLYGICI